MADLESECLKNSKAEVSLRSLVRPVRVISTRHSQTDIEIGVQNPARLDTSVLFPSRHVVIPTPALVRQGRSSYTKPAASKRKGNVP